MSRVQRSPRIESRFQAHILRVNAVDRPSSDGLHTRNLSLEGLRLLFPEACPLVLGDEVEGRLKLMPSDNPDLDLEVRFTAKVMWARDRECGLQYQSMDKLDRSLYAKLLESLQDISSA